ncbi:hypothetical protein WG904_03175 [Pedobacter sp. Du54]|uniref:hypothetical protein n=1 Tax=Pedobacter anseongensis TaxID=3133439 RepID=UPI0030A518A6
MSIFISVGAFTVLNTLSSSSRAYAENFSEKSQESDEKSSEPFNSPFIHELALELLLPVRDDLLKSLTPVQFSLSLFCPSPNTPPPDLSE